MSINTGTSNTISPLKLLNTTSPLKSSSAQNSLPNPKPSSPHRRRIAATVPWQMATHRWGANAVTQVTKANFSRALQQIKEHIRESDYIAVSSQKTGGGSRRWHRVLPIDTPQTAYLKCKLAAETYEILQFAVCPFRIDDGSKVVAFPYNFHLFPRDELNTGMPSYSFSCQASFLSSMAQEGFDFNACIYDGISYLSRVQEVKAKERSSLPRLCQEVSTSSFSTADKIFMDRIKSKLQHWKKVCKGPSKTGEDALLSSLRKLIVGSELHGSRPCLNIDICSNRQVQLVMKALNQSFDDIVPIVIPNRDAEPKAIRAVLTSTEEDKNLLINELQHQEEENDMKIRGFREIIDLISSSHKPIIGYDCLSEFTYGHLKFLGPLPPTLPELMCSLRMVFRNIVDVSHLLKEIGPLKKAKNLPAAIAYLRRQFFAPVDMEILKDDGDPCKNHGHNVLRVTHVFAKVASILNITSSSCFDADPCMSSIEEYSNIFIPCGTGPEGCKDDELWMDDARKVKTSNFIFIWGFKEGTSAKSLKTLLRGTHSVFSEDFELRLIDRSCAVALLSRPWFVKSFLADIEAGHLRSGALMELMSEGLKATGYDTYKRVCESSLWHADLADSLDKAMLNAMDDPVTDVDEDPLDIDWPSKSETKLIDLL